MERYNHLNKFLKEKFGERVLKICIDGNFTCPNRDGTLSKSGCIFCSEYGSGEHIKKFLKDTNKELINTNTTEEYIKYQINNYFNSYKASRANKFIAYFQNFSNTYDTLANLKAKYDAALINNKIVALAIATRPDCINEDICKLIESYKNKVYVWVELGLQTSNEQIGKIINRKYLNNQFTDAVKLLNKYNIDVVTHIMVGLPNETAKDIKTTTDFINNHKIKGIKIHSTYIVKNTKLEEMYKKREYSPISLEYYIENACNVLANLNPEIIIHKISGDSPKDLLVAPSWNLHKKWIINGIDKYLKENNLYQGIYYKK